MFGPESHVVVVVGAQWGDEGKGKLVDVLASTFGKPFWIVFVPESLLITTR